MISINTGQAKLQTGNFKIIHTIDIDEYENVTSGILDLISTDGCKGHHLFPYISYELGQIQNLIENLKPRKSKRSLNFIGSAWKWIAGTPDHDDFITIKQKTNNVLENNNKQVIINNLLTERLNNLTIISNEINKVLKNSETISDKLILDIGYKLKILKEDLRNINYAIHWAKAGVINSLILSKQEIKVAVNTFKKENLPFNTVEEALNFSEVKIITNYNTILYIINIPITNHDIFQKIILRPVKRNKIATEILYENILKRDDEIFALKENCKTFNFVSICNSKNIIDLSNSTCIPNILKSIPADCDIINNQHIPTIEEITPGIILLNNFNGTILVDTLPQKLNGTFLVKFRDVHIKINDQLFISKEVSHFQALPAILHPLHKEKEAKKVLSLEMMEELHINNTNVIEMLQSESMTNRFLIQGFTIPIGVVLVAVILKCLRPFIRNWNKVSQKNLEQVTIETPKVKKESSNDSISQDSEIMQDPFKTSSADSSAESIGTSKPNIKFNDIPFF